MRPLGGGDGCLRLGARRIDHADEAEQHQVVLDALRQLDVRPDFRANGLRIEVKGGRRQVARGDGEHAQRLCRERVVAAREIGAPRPRPSGTILPSSQTWRLFASSTSGAPLTNTRNSIRIFAIDDGRWYGACAPT